MEIPLEENISSFVDLIGHKSTIVIRRFYIGKGEDIRAAIIYINALAVKDIIDSDILKPLMFDVDEDIKQKDNLLKYVEEKYVPVCSTELVSNIYNAVEAVKRGKTVLVIDSQCGYLVADTAGGNYRAISEPSNESVIRGAREGFVENIETNISIIRRKVRDKNLEVELLKVGRRSQNDLALVYIKDIADSNMVNKIKDKLAAIDVDEVTATGMLEQYMCRYEYNIFPQFGGTERPDRIEANIMEGRVAIILEGTPYVITIPSLFTDYFQTTEDYYQRWIIGSFLRMLRLFSAFVVITLDAFFLTLVSTNNEFVPLKFVIPIAQSRQDVALSVFSGLLLLELIVELLREGGLRLPSKIAQTLSVVGGIIIGDAIVNSKFVSASSLFVVGVTTVASFMISNYDMAVAVRFLRFPILIMANFFGLFGIGVGWFLIFAYLCSLENFDVPYFSFKLPDIQDQLLRVPLWMMDRRPKGIPNRNPLRQSEFRKKVKEDNDEK